MKGRGQANFDNGGQGLAAEREAGAAGNCPILPSAQGEGQQKGGSLRGHCGVGRAHGSQGQDAYQEKVQQEVDGGGRRNAEKGDFGGAVADYEPECVSSTVIKIIQSYTRIIDTKVWRK